MLRWQWVFTKPILNDALVCWRQHVKNSKQKKILLCVRRKFLICFKTQNQYEVSSSDKTSIFWFLNCLDRAFFWAETVKKTIDLVKLEAVEETKSLLRITCLNITSGQTSNVVSGGYPWRFVRQSANTYRGCITKHSTVP